jgi:hypothetical protein
MSIMISAFLLTGCATVRQADLDSWVGAPVAALDTHPIFLTVPVVRTIASDGTEMRNYMNGRNTLSCDSGGTAFRSAISMATFNSFTSCMQTFAACNNIFRIKDGVIQSYTPIGTGGAQCYTDQTLRPGFRGPANIR